MSISKAMPPLSNLQFVSEDEVAISLERLLNSVVMEVAANRSAQQLQQVNESHDDTLGIDFLPNEIIEKIFSHLTQNQLGQIARVCRRWKVLTKSPVLWKKVKVKFFCAADIEKDDQSLKYFIDGLPSCVTFIQIDFLGPVYQGFRKFRKYLNFEELCVKLRQNSPSAEALILAHCKISTIFPEVINICTQFLQSLKKLVLHDCHFKYYSGTTEFKDNSKIEVLDVSLCGISDISIAQFSKFPSLKELRLASTGASDSWFETDSSDPWFENWFVASFFNQLHVLDLGFTCIKHSTFRAIQRHGQNLKELYLCRLDLFDNDLDFDKEVFPHLKTICLRNSSVSCEGLVSLIRSCPSLVNVYVDSYVAEHFPRDPFVVANRCKSEIVKDIPWIHNHSVDYSQS